MTGAIIAIFILFGLNVAQQFYFFGLKQERDSYKRKYEELVKKYGL